MKKRILAMLLSGLLLLSATACQTVPENEIDTPQNLPPVEDLNAEVQIPPQDLPTVEEPNAEEQTPPQNSSSVEEPNEESGNTESEYDPGTDPTQKDEAAGEEITDNGTTTETKPPRKCPGSCNGVWGKSGGTYTFNQNGDLSVHIADWGETHLFTSIADEDIAAVNYYASAIGVNGERAFLVLDRYYENKITVVSFEKGSQNETVVTFDVDKAVDKISGNLIDENVGYLFAFEEKDTGGSTLSGLFKTEDGGKTWNSINVQSTPSIGQREYIMFARMASEDVGLISGNVWGYDYNFCERTLLTTDGGLNWVNVNIPELPEDDNLLWAKVADFSQIDGSYILTIRYSTPEGTYDEAKYKLLDSNTWVRIS